MYHTRNMFYHAISFSCDIYYLKHHALNFTKHAQIGNFVSISTNMSRRSLKMEHIWLTGHLKCPQYANVSSKILINVLERWLTFKFLLQSISLENSLFMVELISFPVSVILALGFISFHYKYDKELKSQFVTGVSSRTDLRDKIRLGTWAVRTTQYCPSWTFQQRHVQLLASPFYPSLIPQ